MKREVGDYIEDIINAMNKALQFVKGMSYDEFTKDDKTIFAVIRSLEVIGEAVKNIPETIREKYPEIPWKAMAGMRDELIHEYFGVSIPMVWDIIQSKLTDLKGVCLDLLNEKT